MKKGIFFSITCFLFATGGDKTYAQTEDQWVPNDVLFKIMSVRFKQRNQKKDWPGIFHFIILCYP